MLKNIQNEIHDVREMIPEFYYQTELFINRNRNDFGSTQDGIIIDHVDLPF